MIFSLLLRTLYLGLVVLSVHAAASSTTARCSSENIKLPDFPGLEVLQVEVNALVNETLPGSNMTWSGTISGLSICNITVVYTHIGWNDTVTAFTWTPLEYSSWNGRFLGFGGGGWVTGGFYAQQQMPSFALDGFAVAGTDGGQGPNLDDMDWITAPGIMDWQAVYDFASVGLHDMATIGKAVVEAYYAKPPEYSYFLGFSTGGRQGHMLAQKYPDDFDGIVGGGPAMHWTKFLLADVYAHFIMDTLDYYPRPCEVDAFTIAARKACDGLDGVEDGFISLPGLCHFDPYSLVGQAFDCHGVEASVTEEAAKIIEAAWNGPRSSQGDWQWYGLPHETNLTDPIVGGASTVCPDNGTCGPGGFLISYKYIAQWIVKDADFDFHNMTHENWDRIFHDSIDQYLSIIDASNPDLTPFNRAGHKFISWHGIADRAIPFNGSVQYADEVSRLDPNSMKYYRFFVVPGDSHGFPALRPSNSYLVDTLRDWVEKGIAPETLMSSGLNGYGVEMTRESCLHPKISHYVGGDPTVPSSYECE